MFGTPIVFGTAVTLFLAMAIATAIGRPLALLFPFRVRAPARFYLAPILGLALVTALASHLARYLPTGLTPWPRVLITLLLVSAIWLERRSLRALLVHCGGMGLFGVVAAVSILAPIFVFGSLNVHNDTFTYLAISDWLQGHAFSQPVTLADVTPATTQVQLYQALQLRMGSNYLLALLQTLTDRRWALDAYPLAASLGVAASSLVVGLPLARVLRPFARPTRLLLLTLPAMSLGGVEFAASFGFLPQLYGVMFAAAALFAWQGTLDRFSRQGGRPGLQSSLPVGLLAAASVLCYTEFSPFFVAAMAVTALVFAVRSRRPLAVAGFALLVAAIAALLLNSEIRRAIVSLNEQRNAVVGGAVNWSLLGFIAHAMGLHGGAWDLGQWTTFSGWEVPLAGVALTLAALGGLLFAVFRARRWFIAANVAPLVTLALLGVALLYLRYVAANPFQTGHGQSWSEFKVADWAYLFVAAAALSALLPIVTRWRLLRRGAVLLCLIAIIGASLVGVMRVSSMAHYYEGVGDIDAYFPALRQKIIDTCPQAPAVYLDLTGPDQKFRQMVSLVLDDMTVKSDWRDDGYIFHWLPPSKVVSAPSAGDCLVQSVHAGGHGETFGPARISLFDGKMAPAVLSVDGDYQREADATSWWIWVRQSVKLSIGFRSGARPAAASTPASFTAIISTSMAQVVTATTDDGRATSFQVPPGATRISVPLVLRDDGPSHLVLTSSGAPQPIGNGDPRQVTFLLKNADVIP